MALISQGNIEREQVTGHFRAGASLALLWYGVLGGPLGFALDLAWSYAQVPHGCSTGHHYMLHLITGISLAIAAGALAAAWVSRARTPHDVTFEGGSSLARARFMAAFGIAISLFFMVVMIANAVPRFILSPCD
jgi:hypothetical protein